jgi:hypothetical protein
MCVYVPVVASDGAHQISERGLSALLLQRQMRGRGGVAREVLKARRDDPLRSVLWRHPVTRATTPSDALFTTVCVRKCAAVCARLCAAVCAWKCAWGSVRGEVVCGCLTVRAAVMCGCLAVQ